MALEAVAKNSDVEDDGAKHNAGIDVVHSGLKKNIKIVLWKMYVNDGGSLSIGYNRCQSPKYENGFKYLWHLASGRAMNTNDENVWFFVFG